MRGCQGEESRGSCGDSGLSFPSATYAGSSFMFFPPVSDSAGVQVDTPDTLFKPESHNKLYSKERRGYVSWRDLLSFRLFASLLKPRSVP
jgi:hypothetical protein